MVLSVAYVMSKLKFKSRKLILNVSIILGLFPGFMSIIAVYYILKFMGLTQSLFALILVYSAGSGLGFYIAKGFFDLIPKNLLESAKLDGATNFQSFMRIILPLSKPIIIYTALMSFSGPWMDFIFARVIIGETNPEKWTVAVGLYMMLFGSQATADPNRFTIFAAGSIIVAIPIVLLFVIMQRYYVEGVTAGAVKG
jgi:arabinogalactan oligomer/maltooligosaccharide transport system permease protein